MFMKLSEWDTEYVDICASNKCSLMFNTAVVDFSTEIEKKVNYVAFYFKKNTYAYCMPGIDLPIRYQIALSPTVPIFGGK